jgi:hypothetical protein
MRKFIALAWNCSNRRSSAAWTVAKFAVRR